MAISGKILVSFTLEKGRGGLRDRKEDIYFPLFSKLKCLQ